MEPSDLSEPTSLTKLKEAVILALKDGEAVFSPNPKLMSPYGEAKLWINGRMVIVTCEAGIPKVTVAVESPTGGVIDLSFDSNEVTEAFWRAAATFWVDKAAWKRATHHHLTISADVAAKELGL